ncbi:MAG: hypothetical protein AAGB48_03090 [Planctomycetota bacterium]
MTTIPRMKAVNACVHLDEGASQTMYAVWLTEQDRWVNDDPMDSDGSALVYPTFHQAQQYAEHIRDYHGHSCEVRPYCVVMPTRAECFPHVTRTGLRTMHIEFGGYDLAVHYANPEGGFGLRVMSTYDNATGKRIRLNTADTECVLAHLGQAIEAGDLDHNDAWHDRLIEEATEPKGGAA